MKGGRSMKNRNIIANDTESDRKKRIERTASNLHKLSYLGQIKADSYILGLLACEQPKKMKQI